MTTVVPKWVILKIGALNSVGRYVHEVQKRLIPFR